jgi:putative ABC transport system permease protein
LITTGTLVVAAVIAGTVPALFARNVAPADVLRHGGRGSVGSSFEKRWGRVLIGGEVALTLVLLVAGGLLVRTYGELSSADLGYERERLVRLAVTLSRADYGTPEQLPAVYKRLHDELAAVPGAERIGLVHPTLPPYDGQRMRIRLQGVEMPESPEGLEVGAHLADENLLPMFGARMVAGRNLQESDATAEETVAVISATLAELMGGAEQALGKTITFTDPNDMPSGDARVVGVVENLAYEGLTSDLRQVSTASASPRERHDVYVPLARYPQTIVSIGAWTSGDPASIIDPLRRKIVEIAPLSPVHWDATMEEEVAVEYAPTRFYLIMVAAFSVSALLLTSIGLYALLSQAATRRTNEMGLRIALGATPASIMRLLLRAGMLPLAGGVIVGLGLSAYVAYAMKSLLFGVGSFDVVTFAIAAAVLFTVTLAAGYVPARRIAAVDPMVALRDE